MYVRSAKDRDETWLIDLFTEAGYEVDAFRPEEFVVAVDETTGSRLGAGRLVRHENNEAGAVSELAALVVRPQVRKQGVGAHLVERIAAHAADSGTEQLYVQTDHPRYFTQFGFRGVEDIDRPAALPASSAEDIVMSLPPARFQMPERLRRRFKQVQLEDTEPARTTADEFEVTTEDATYKYEP